MAQDGLGSVRTIIDNTLSVDTVQSYDPIGNPMGSYGPGFGFTGEQTDHTGQLYLRARYYDPGIGTFTALDPFEGMMDRPMSLNGYSWVEGNPINWSDKTGAYPCVDEDCTLEAYLFARDLQALNAEMLDYGARTVSQNRCNGASVSPFGCDEQGNPIPYMLVQDFLNSPYPGADLCSSGGDFYANTHCGVDLVSYTDPAWLWTDLGDSREIIRIRTSEGEFSFDRRSGEIAAVGTRNFTERASRQMLRDGIFQYKGYPNNDVPQGQGRKVFAVTDGAEVRWTGAPDYTLIVKVDENLEVQYTHLADPPLVTSGGISRGQEIGRYGNYGATGDPHLHITYKKSLTGIACPGENATDVVFENPLLSITHRFWVPTTLRQPPPHIRTGRARHQNGIWRVNNGAETITERW